MVKRVCDRCGEEIESGLFFVDTACDPVDFEISLKNIYCYNDREIIGSKTIDLCRNCKKQFYKWLSDKNNLFSTKGVIES